MTSPALARAVEDLGRQARRALGEAGATLQATYELRYRGQSFELAIHGSTAPSVDELRAAFEAEHNDRYGYIDSDQPLELVTVRVTATTPGAEVALAGSHEGGELRHRRRAATLDRQRAQLDVLSGTPPPGTSIRGPAVIELPESTVLVPPGWSGAVDDTGTIRLERAQ